MKKVFLYVIIGIAAVAAILWKLNSNKQKNAERTAIVQESTTGAVNVLTEVVTRTTFDQSLTANGNFAAVKQIDFTSESAGRITQLTVKEGSRVSAGQVLARIDNQVASADLENAQASVNAAKTDMERYQKALASGGVTQKQADDMKLQYQSALSRLTAARKNAQNTQLRSPINGVINAKYVEIGAYLSAGTKLFEIVDISKLKLITNVPESQVVQLKVGQQVPVTTNVYPEVTYKGKITFIAVKGDATLNYPVEIEVDNISDKALKAGMYGSATFDLPEQEPVLLISRAAFYAGLTSNLVYVLENGRSKSVKVVSGRVIGDKVEIRKGLKEGDIVITSGQVNLVNGTEVSVQNK